MAMETFTFLAQEAPLFEAASPDHFPLEDDRTDWLELDPTSPCMALFQEVGAVQEVKESRDQEQETMLLAQLISECGIPVEQEQPTSPCSSQGSDLENHQSLIEELEDFFGSPTMLQEDETPMNLDLIGQTTVPTTTINPASMLTDLNTISNHHLTEQDLQDAITTSCVMEDGQSVIIIIAPPSPTSSLTDTTDYTTDTTEYNTDPEWLPSSNPTSPQEVSNCGPMRKKYARKKPPSPPSGPYPVERKERKKAQNRTAAFRYREKKKGEQEGEEAELEGLQQKQTDLKAKLSEMEIEARLLKKMMMQAGLGRYANAIKI